MHIVKQLLFVFFGLLIFFFTPAVAHAAELHLSNDRVTLDATDFSITTAGKTFVGNNISLNSDPGTPSYTTLEATWHENDVEMRLQMYFSVSNGEWRVTEIRTYNGASPNGDWLLYNGFTGGPLGSTYTTGSLDLNSYSGFSGGSGSLHFSNLSLKPNFISPDEGVVIWHPNGGQSYTSSTMVQLDWRLNKSGLTDPNQTFKTSIYLQKADGTNVQTIVNNQNITKIGSSHYDWMVPVYAGTDYKIVVVLSDLNLSDSSDAGISIQGSSQNNPSPTQSTQPTSTPTPSSSQSTKTVLTTTTATATLTPKVSQQIRPSETTVASTDAEVKSMTTDDTQSLDNETEEGNSFSNFFEQSPLINFFVNNLFLLQAPFLHSFKSI